MILIGKRQRPEEHGIDYGEDSRVEANAEGQGRNDSGCKYRCFAKRTNRKLYVVNYVFEPPDAARVSTLLFDTFYAMQTGQRMLLRFFRRNSISHPSFKLTIEIVAQL